MGLKKITDGLSEETFNARNRELHAKVNAGLNLSSEEELFFCSCLPFRKLLQYPFCGDQFFINFFLQLDPRYPGNEISSVDEHKYFQMIEEWGKLIEQKMHSDPLLQVIASETLKEFKTLQKNIVKLGEELQTPAYWDAEIRLLEWSKYRYITIKRIILQSKLPAIYLLPFNGQVIVFDYESLCHILTRHFGVTMKPYPTTKSHFDEDIPYDNIHGFLAEVFKKINISNQPSSKPPLEIYFRYKIKWYTIYMEKIRPANDKEASAQTLRIASFFPIENQNLLKRILDDYMEKQIDQFFSVLVKKQ